MKNLVLFLFVFVVGLWVTEGKQTTDEPMVTKGPSVNNQEEIVTTRPFSSETATNGEAKPVTEGPSIDNEAVDSGNSTIEGGNATPRRAGRKTRSACIGRCKDIYECRRWRLCGKYGRCISTPGSYKCSCKRGFRFDGRTCVDINECALVYCGFGATCYNTPGSYYCDCRSGYQRIRGLCKDINECLRNPCPYGVTCHNFPGSYRCACKNGYRFENNRCVDIDECRHNNGGCPFPYRCVNRPGFHYCDCPFGFEAEGNMCHLSIPQSRLNFTIPGNPTAIPKMKSPK